LHERLRTGIEAAVNADGPPVLFDVAEQSLDGTIVPTSRMLDAVLRDVARGPATRLTGPAYCRETCVLGCRWTADFR
jgi:hypothetical protein